MLIEKRFPKNKDCLLTNLQPGRIFILTNSHIKINLSLNKTTVFVFLCLKTVVSFKETFVLI